MAPQLTEEEIDDLVYFARAGEDVDLMESVTALAEREKVVPAVILMAAKDEGKSTVLHMATGNGHLGMLIGIAIVDMEHLPGLRVSPFYKQQNANVYQKPFAKSSSALTEDQRKRSRHFWTSPMSMATPACTGQR